MPSAHSKQEDRPQVGPLFVRRFAPRAFLEAMCPRAVQRLQVAGLLLLRRVSDGDGAEDRELGVDAEDAAHRLL